MSTLFLCFFFLHVDVRLLQQHLLRNRLCSVVLPPFLRQRSVGMICVHLFLRSLFRSSDLLSIFAQRHTIMITVAL